MLKANFAQRTSRPPAKIILRSGRVLDTDARPIVMGILNVTPDSFSDGGSFFSVSTALARAHDMVRLGADIIDIGGESSRPGSKPLDARSEIGRVLPVVRELAAESFVPISIDTRKAAVAEAALEAGAEMINDISALCADAGMAPLAASSGAAVCLMHMQGEPQNMQENPEYGDAVGEIKEWLKARVGDALGAGVRREGILIDPGFGFGKLARHNLELLRRLSEFHEIGCPLLAGISRKSTIGEVLGEPVDGRVYGSLAAAAAAVMAGAHVLRVHDVKATMDVVYMTEAILRGDRWRL